MSMIYTSSMIYLLLPICQAALSILIPQIQKIGHIDIFFLNYVDNDASIISNNHNSLPMSIAGYEQMVRFLLSRSSSPAVVDIGFTTCSSHDLIHPSAVHKPVIEYYRLPSINWSNNTAPPFSLLVNERHPNWPYHQALADLISYVWIKQVENVCNALSQRKQNNMNKGSLFEIPSMRQPMAEYSLYRSSLSYCLFPLTMYSFRDPLALNASLNAQVGNYRFDDNNSKTSKAMDNIIVYDSDGNKFPVTMDPITLLQTGTHKNTLHGNIWSFQDFQDRHKYGFYINSAVGGNISFRVNLAPPHLNRAPSIAIGYLQSHSGFGVVRVTVTKNPFDESYADKLARGLFMLLNGTGSDPSVSVTNLVRLCTNKVCPVTSDCVVHHHEDIPQCKDMAEMEYSKHQVEEDDENSYYLNFELLPITSPAHKQHDATDLENSISQAENRFKLEFIVSS
jgi:hypothetical protein